MEFYTEKQALEIAINSVGATLNYVNEVSSEVSGETIKTIAHGSISKPSTFEMQKQIEAVGGLAVVQSLMGLSVDDLQGAAGSELRLQHKNLTKHLRTLAETLKPYLGDDKLEV